MPTIVCEACGATNSADATFCRACHAFVGWDRTTNMPAVTDAARPTGRRSVAEDPVETRVIPKVVDGSRAPAATTPTATTPPQAVRPVLAVRIDQDRLTVPLSGDPVELTLMITNRSDIVDGYEVDAGGAPDWLKIESSPLRLLPDSEAVLPVRFRIESSGLVPAGQGTVRLRVRSLTQPPASEVVAVGVTVPVVDAPVTLRSEPSVVRVRDADTTRFVVVVDNGAANRPAKVRLSGTDPEMAVGFHFDPAVVVLGPGEATRVRAVTTSTRPQPGAELTRMLTVSATEGKRRVDTIVTLVQATSMVVEDPPVELVATPSLVRLRDADTATVRVSVDNRAGRQWATVRLAASDPEQVVRAQWGSAEVRVPPGGSTEAEVRLAAPLPEAGTEVTRAVTLTASDGRRVVRTQVSLVHSASASPMTTLAVGLDPSVLRLGNGRRGASSVMVDNRSGRSPVRVWLRGDDPENVVAFTFTPAELTVAPGQVLTGRMAVSAPRAPSGREISRPLTVAATDGRTSVSTSGSIIQTAGDRRPWARLVLTLAGGLAMIIGTMLPLRAANGRTPFGVNVDTVAGLFGADVDLGGLEQLITHGLVIMVLAGLMVFGLTGRSGRLTRWMAVLAVLITVGLMITIAALGIDATPGSGTVLIILGCVLGYAGGLLARR